MTVPNAAVAALAATVGPVRDPVVQVPVDLDVEARLAGPVTFRMAGWLAIAAAGGMLVGTNLGSPWLMLTGLVVSLIGWTGAYLRPAGRPLMAWVLPLLGYHRRRRAAAKARRD